MMEFHEVLNYYVRPQTFPVAFKMCASAEEVPAEARRPMRDMKVRIAVCQGVGMARKYGWTLAMGKEDQVCPWGALALGFAPPKRQWFDGSIAEMVGYRDKGIVSRIAAELPRFDFGRYSHVVLAPINTAAFECSAIAIYGNSAQVMTLLQASIYATGGMLHSSSSGMADCADMIVRTSLTKECRFILPCGGDRVFGMTQNDEMIFTLPPSHMEVIAEGLKRGLKAGVQRYPTPAYLRFEPQMPTAYQKLMEFLSES